MAAPLIEITGIFLRERQRWDSTVIAEIDERAAGPNGNGSAGSMFGFFEGTSVKLTAEENELQAHQSYRFYGRWENHPKYGKQFHAQTFVRSQPHGRAGITRYLSQAPHVGEATARKLWDRFGSDAVRVLRESPDVASAAVGGQFSLIKATEAAASLAEDMALESCTIDLIDLLGGRGFPKSTAKAAVKAWGNRAPEFIRRDPYLLMKFRGCGFKKTDAMYVHLGGNPAKLKRQALSAWYALARDSEGHTWHQIETAVAGIRENVGGAELQPTKAIKLAERAGAITIIRIDREGRIVERPMIDGKRQHVDGDRVYVAESKKARNELYVAEKIAEALTEEPIWHAVALLDGFLSKRSDERLFDDESPNPPDDEYHQRCRLLGCLRGCIAILGGSPGTGKTYAAAAFIRAICELQGIGNVAVAAPTGKAAVRVTESLARYGVGVQARTIHSLLGVSSREDGSGWSFAHNADNPLPYRFIVVDESSMIDTDLMASLLAARAVGCHVLFVGDINQLPPVGHGAPLRDMIAAGVPYGELREIRRNAGDGVFACAAIRDGKPFRTSTTLDPEHGRNLWMDLAYTPEQQIAATLAAIAEAKSRGFDPIWDCQVIVPVNRKSKVSRVEINTLLQAELNKSEPVAGCPFRVGDKIINTENGLFPIARERMAVEELAGIEIGEDGKVRVANGEQARVVECLPKLIVAELSAPKRIVKIPRGNAGDAAGDDDGDGKAEEKTNTGCTWDLAYAITIHRSQGSDWPVVIVIGDEYPGARKVFCREATYTGISRFKYLCRLIGKKQTFDAFCRNVALNKRKTFLKELIKREMERCRSDQKTSSISLTKNLQSCGQ